MPTVGEFVQAFRPITSQAATWDPVGLQFGDPNEPVSSVAVAHEVSDALVGRLEADRPGLLVAYHPLLFRPASSLVSGPSPPGRAFRLIAAGVALLVVHTGWDVYPGGTADRLAATLGLADVTPFGMQSGDEARKLVTFVPASHELAVVEALAATGAGRIGDYAGCAFSSDGSGMFTAPADGTPFVGGAGETSRVDERRLEMVVPTGGIEAAVRALLTTHPYEEPAFDVVPIDGPPRFIGRVGEVESITLGALGARLADRLGFDGVRIAGDPDRTAGRVGVVPGSGADFIGSARAAGVEVLVTGDVGHHRAQAALDAGLAIIDVGHIPGERPGVGALVEETRSRLNVPVLDCTDLDPNPWETP